MHLHALLAHSTFLICRPQPLTPCMSVELSPSLITLIYRTSWTLSLLKALKDDIRLHHTEGIFPVFEANMVFLRNSLGACCTVFISYSNVQELSSFLTYQPDFALYEWRCDLLLHPPSTMTHMVVPSLFC